MTSLVELSVGSRCIGPKQFEAADLAPGKTGRISISDVGPVCKTIVCHAVNIDVACAGVDGRAVPVTIWPFRIADVS